MIRLIRAEIFKLRKRSMTYILLAILVGFIVLILSISQATVLNSTTAVTIDNNGVSSTTVMPVVAADVHFLEDIITSVMSILGSVGMILAVVLVANGMGSEYSWNTIRPYLLCSESRLKMFTAKLITAGIFIITGMIIGVFTAVLLGALFTAIRGFSWELSSGTVSFIGRELLTFTRTLYVMLPYILLAFLFTVLGRSTAAGIGFGIGASVLESIITGLLSMTHGWLAKIPQYLLSTNIQTINALSQSSLKLTMGTNTQITSTPHAFIVLAIYCVVFIAVSFIIFQKRDVTG
jgi:ABC-2 type transport system permease protein